MKLFKKIFPIAFFLLILIGSFSPAYADETIYQYSTIDSLLLGNYDGDLTVSELKKHGDFGIGTFNGLNGEMVFIDGEVYRVGYNGKAVAVDNLTRVPFADALIFKTDSILKIDSASSLEELNLKITNALPSSNIFFAIRIDGRFNMMRTRSVPEQKKPYPPLIDVVKHQSIFKFTEIEGSLIGIKSPAYVKGIGVPGFHWHFITKDRTAGGHVLGCQVKNLIAKVGSYNNFFLQLPKTKSFLDSDLSNDKEKELKKVEKDSIKD
ncbi:acetolactate decarboxylase [Maridesulfovibrio ferrireducens]|uniref:acetolactate decarboxylase n=1 Tax=Maridesulfovibrio ferrireducens TaxID=246191 RepID=UPI001A261312|nr:acetolactate decarboxylase [Maridesulfovibrio ferrireducens]MBI9111750.1 acetolactate decarboxylase [Maridesulfovibrio ferrireducens]